MTEDTQEENCISLLNEVKIIKNAQELNELTTTKEHKNRILFSNHQPVKKNDESGVGGISKFFTLKRILGLISSVTGAIFLWQAGRNILYKDNQACLSIASGIDSLNATSMGDAHNVNALTSDRLPLNLYRNENPFYNNRLCEDENLSLHEYLKEIEVINNLALPNVDRLYRIISSIDHKRILRTITTPPGYQVNVSGVMSNILNNDDIDWRIREEFSGVYHRAMNSSEINQAKDDVEKNVKLILSTVSLMLQYLHKNRMENLSKVSFIYGIAFIESFLSILDEMKAYKSGTIDKRYKKQLPF